MKPSGFLFVLFVALFHVSFTKADCPAKEEAPQKNWVYFYGAYVNETDLQCDSLEFIVEDYQTKEELYNGFLCNSKDYIIKVPERRSYMIYYLPVCNTDVFAATFEIPTVLSSDFWVIQNLKLYNLNNNIEILVDRINKKQPKEKSKKKLIKKRGPNMCIIKGPQF